MATYIGSSYSTSEVRRKDDFTVVYVNSFSGDRYHSFNDVEDEEVSALEGKIDKIKHINKDPDTYLASLRLYNEYMEILMNRYGGEELFRIKLKNKINIY